MLSVHLTVQLGEYPLPTPAPHTPLAAPPRTSSLSLTLPHVLGRGHAEQLDHGDMLVSGQRLGEDIGSHVARSDTCY